ncbi:MAG: hypothetical protein RLZZ546_1093 [Bacteroidota bacterium]|jgi:LacI family transcriptional regulator
MNKITIKDIAKMLSLSVSTVSRALSDHPDISQETKNRVKSVAERFNYLPNLHARFFRKKNTKLIALILPDFNRFFVPDLIAGIQKIIDLNGFSLIIFQSNNSIVQETEIIKYCLSWVVEGVLISLSNDTVSLEHLDILQNNDIPVVILDKVLKSDLYSTATINDAEAAYTATSFLFKSNRKNILGIFGHENLSITKDRIKGFERSLIEHENSISDTNVLIVNNISEINSLFNKLSIDHIDGIFLMTDELLIHTLNKILDLNKSIPQDIGIVSISDGTSPYFLRPRITHIFHSGYLVGQTACQLLFNHLFDKSFPIEHKIVDTTLVNLNST